MPQDRFQTILIAPNGIREVFPVGVTKLKEKSTLDDGDIFYYKSIVEGELTFIGADYQHLSTWNRTDKRCKKSTLIIKKLINGVFVEKLRYIIAPDDIEWFPDICTCKLKVKKELNKFDKYHSIKDNTRNLYEITSHSVIWNTAPAAVIGYRTVPNGMYLFDVIEALLFYGYPGMIVKSKFFGRNDTQDYIIGHSAQLTKLILSHNSDIYTAYTAPAGGGGSVATIMEMKLSELLDTICYMFNLKCDIESNSVFRIEHISWFDTSLGLIADATVGDNLTLNNGRLYNSRHENKERYAEEHFDPFINKDGSDPNFIGTPIIYNKCNSSSNAILNKKSLFTATVKFNADTIPGMDITQGIFIGALNASNELEFPAVNPPIGNSRYNSILGWAYLQHDYHRHGKSYTTALMGGTNPGGGYYTLQSVGDPYASPYMEEWDMETKRFLSQPGIKIKDCNHELVLIKRLVKTGLGEGMVKSTIREFGNDYIECDVYFYDVTSGTVFVPTAVNDSYTTSTNTSIDTFAGSLASLKANDSPATCTIYAETKATDQGGTVEINATGHFIYTPALDYEGEDTFDYYLINTAGYVSTGVCKITVS